MVRQACRLMGARGGDNWRLLPYSWRGLGGVEVWPAAVRGGGRGREVRDVRRL